MNHPDPLCSGSTMKSMASSDLKGVPFLFSEKIDLGAFQSMANSTALFRWMRPWPCPQQMKSPGSLSFSPKKATCHNHKQSIPPCEHLRKTHGFCLTYSRHAAGSKSFPSYTARTSVNRSSGASWEADYKEELIKGLSSPTFYLSVYPGAREVTGLLSFAPKEVTGSLLINSPCC